MEHEVKVCCGAVADSHSGFVLCEFICSNRCILISFQFQLKRVAFLSSDGTAMGATINVMIMMAIIFACWRLHDANTALMREREFY